MSTPWTEGIMKSWVNDIPNGEKYTLLVHSEKSVTATYGRFSHSSGSKTVNWSSFLAGDLDDLVLKSLGKEVLIEAKTFVQKYDI